MTEYKIRISGVHYGANGDSVAGQEETAEMKARTLELLRWIDRERPFVTLSPDPSNPIHKNAIKARSRGKKIGRVAKDDIKRTWDLLRQSGKPMLMARVSEVVIREHGYIVVSVDAEELQATTPVISPDMEWQQWLSDLPLLPPSELLEKEQEAAFMLDSLFMPHLEEADTDDLKFYLDLWTEGCRHDLSYETCQKRSEYIRCLESAQDKAIRQLAEPLKEQGRRMCERAFLDEHATVWWAERMESFDVNELWQTWKLKNENMLWLGLRRIDSLLRQLPGELYKDVGQLDVVLSRLYYLDTPRKAFQSILALMMLRELTCRELGIEMRPMTEVEYQQDGRISNPMDMPTTIGRVVAFGETRCDRGQRQTIELLVHWLRDDYEQCHPQELEALSEDTQAKLADAVEKAANKPTTQNIYGDKNEFKEDSKLLKLTLPANADPAEIAMRIAEQQKQIEKKKNNKSGKSAK